MTMYYSNEQIQKAKKLSTGKVSAKQRGIYDGVNFKTVWTGTIGGVFIGFGHCEHDSMELALADARAFKQHALKVSQFKTDSVSIFNSPYTGAEIFVVVAEYDVAVNGAGRPIVFETYVDKASLDEMKAFQQKIGGNYGKTRIAKLVFIED
jgi:hypothetical protein